MEDNKSIDLLSFFEKPICRFKCQKCLREFEKPIDPTDCIFCGHNYVDWLDPEKIIDSLPQNIGGKTT